MSEAIQYQEKEKSVESQNLVNVSYFSLANLDRMRFGVMAILLLLVGCGAGIAVGLGALEQVFSLIILAITTMSALSMMLAIAPIKAVLYTSVVAIAADIIIILVNTI
jgi:hypothetical protein